MSPNENAQAVQTLLADKLNAWLEQFIILLPNLLAGLLVLIFFIGIAFFGAKAIKKVFIKSDRLNLGIALSNLFRGLLLLLGMIVAITIIFPSFKVVDLMTSLGFGTIAIGFAFKDILQNWLSGLLILFRQPFKIGDTIKIKEFEGTVKQIQNRATILKTVDSQEIVIPNNIVYASPVLVQTQYSQQGSE